MAAQNGISVFRFLSHVEINGVKLWFSQMQYILFIACSHGGIMSNTGSPMSSPASSNPNNGASLTSFFGLSRDQFVNVALRAAAPVAGLFVVLWLTLELFAGGHLADVGISANSLAAAVSLLSLGARITLGGTAAASSGEFAGDVSFSAIWLTFPIIIYVGAWFGLRKYVGILPKKGLAIASAVGAGLITFGLKFLVGTSKSLDIEGIDAGAEISISVLTAVLVAAAAAALATVRFTDHPLLHRAKASVEILRSVGIWLVNTALFAWIVGAMYFSLYEGSGSSEIGIFGWLKVSILVALAVVLIILMSPHWLSIGALLAVGASIISRGETLFGSFFDESSNTSKSAFNLPLSIMIPIVVVMILAAARVAKTQRSELWYESAIVFGLVGGVAAFATKISISGSASVELFGQNLGGASNDYSSGLDLLPSIVRMAALGAVLGSLQHPRVLPHVAKATSRLEQIFSGLRKKLVPRNGRMAKIFSNPFRTLVSKNRFIARNNLAQRVIAVMLTSAIAVLFAAGSGNAIATVGERFVSDPRAVAESVADAYIEGNPAGIKEYMSTDMKILPSSGTAAEVRELNSNNDSFRSFEVVLSSSGTVVAIIEAYKSSDDSDTHFFGLVRGWNINVRAIVPSINHSYSGVSGITVKLNGKATSSSSTYVMPGEFKVDLVSDSPSLINGGSETLTVLESTEISLQPTLTALGGETAIQVVRDSLNSCVGVLDCVPNWSNTQRKIVLVPTVYTTKFYAGQVEVTSDAAGAYEYPAYYCETCAPELGEYWVSAVVEFKNGTAVISEWNTP